MIKIGISACFMYPDHKREIFAPKTLLYMGLDMSHYLGLSGIMPILIPDLPDDKMFYNFLDQMDGFLFQGGLDITPEVYGETPLNFKFEGDPQRDIYELKILDYAIITGKPVLGICRGMQLINVYFGGTLYQDIGSSDINAIKHTDKELYDELTHKIEFTKGNLYEKLHQNCDTVKMVNSVHHQGIKQMGKNLIVQAISPDDNLIEGISCKKGRPITGIQWHPEFFHTMDAPTIPGNIILNHFISQM